MNTPLLAPDLLDRAVSVYGGVTGVVCGDARLTYAQIGTRVNRLSASLAQFGVARGDVVACLSPNCHRLLELYFAVPQMGAILLPVNVRLAPEDIAFILDDSGASVLFVDRALTDLLEPLRERLRQIRLVMMGAQRTGAPQSGHDYEALIDGAAADTYARPQIDEDDVAELFYTSGTTARPKGVMLTHRNLVTHALAIGMTNRCTDEDIQLHSIPLFHVNGWGTPHYLTMAGGRHVMLPRFDPEQVLATIERERITTMLMVPTMAIALLNAPSITSRDLSSLRSMMLGGAATPPSIIEALDRRLPGCRINAGYGLSEATPVLTVAVLKPGLERDRAESVRRRASAGLPIPGVRVEVLDDEGRILPHDGRAVGEICARGNTVMKGYWKRPEESAAALAGGWLHTGDMGSIDPEGYLFIVDRKKDIIVSGGENISSAEIEEVFYGHAGVLECAAIAVPDERWGEVPAVLVVLKKGALCSETDLFAHCAAKLARFKLPKHINFVPALPKGGTGKILKRALREDYGRDLTAASIDRGGRP